MDYNRFACPKTGAYIQADSLYKILDEDCKDSFETVVSICEYCKHAEAGKYPQCKNCYGRIVQKVNKVMTNKGYPVYKKEYYINQFTKNEIDKITRDMKADELTDFMEVISNLNSKNWHHSQGIEDNWVAYDRPNTWKTDCEMCKKKCHDKGCLTSCEKAKEFAENKGVNPDNASEKQLANISLPADCICQQQAQRMFYV